MGGGLNRKAWRCLLSWQPLKSPSFPAEALSASSRICTHADARGIHHWQEHVFAAFVGRGAVFAEPALVVVGTHAADFGGGFAADAAGDWGWDIPGEDLDGFAFGFTFFFGYYSQAQFGGGAEIILVEELEAWAEYFV